MFSKLLRRIRSIVSITTFFHYLPGVLTVEFCLFVLAIPRTRFRVHLHSIAHECPETHCSKQVLYLKFKSLQRESNPQPLSS